MIELILGFAYSKVVFCEVANLQDTLNNDPSLTLENIDEAPNVQLSSVS